MPFKLEEFGEYRSKAISNMLGIAISIADRYGVIIEFNQTTSDWLGYHPENLIGKNLKNLLHPEDIEVVFENIRLLSEQKTKHFHQQIRFLNQQKEIIWTDCSMSPVLNDQGDVEEIICLKTDITLHKLTEIELKDRKEVLRKAQAIANIGNWEWNIIEGTIEWSEKIFAIFKLPVQELSLTQVRDMIHPEDLTHWEDSMQEALLHEKSFQIDYRAMRSDGTVIWIHNEVEVMRDSGGNPLRMLGTAQEITERKIHEDTLRENDERYRRFFENCTLGLFQSTPNGKIINVNQAYAEIFGYQSPEDFLKTIDNIATSIYVNPERRSKNIDVIMNTDKPTEFEDQFRKKDGSIFWGKHHAWAVGKFDGGFKYLEGFIEDITELRRIDHHLQENKERLSAIYSTLDNIAFIITDLIQNEPLIVEFSPGAEYLFKYARTEMIGMPISMLFKSNFSELEAFNPSNQTRFHGEIFVHNRDGETFSALLQTYPILNTQGQVHTLLNVFTGLDEQKKMESQLRVAHKMEAIGTLAGGIAHDFNNMLTIILGNLDLVLESFREPQPEVEFLAEARNASLRAREMIKKFLLFSQKTDCKMQPIKLGTIISEAIEMTRAMFPSNIQITHEAFPKEIFINGDPSLIDHIIINLCTNSAQAMHSSGGEVTISLSVKTLIDKLPGIPDEVPPGEYCIVSINDNGQGISPMIIEKIFDPYFTTKSVCQCTGMGLAVVHGIVREHHGFIHVYSLPEQQTQFDIFFPRLNIPQSETPKTKPSYYQGTERVLFIDDEIDLSKMVDRFLGRLGYRVDVFTNPIKALEHFKANPTDYDVVITDMAMPGISGVDLALEALKIIPDLPIILCTGFSPFINKDRALKKGIREFILKPYSQADLALAIRSVFDRSKKT